MSDVSAGPTSPIQHLTKSEYAYRELRRRILDDEIAPGTRLLLRPLAAELGLSVMPVRDALRMLEGDNLVTFESHRGATVTQISPQAILDIISMRMWLEILAVEEATPRHTAATLARVETELEASERALASDDELLFTQANRRLHEAIEAPAPKVIGDQIDDLWERLWQTRRRMSLFSLEPGRMAKAHDDHGELVAAVLSGDAHKAAAAMAHHRDLTLASWRTALHVEPA
ncbi:MAG: GntR family transcriptional regulator [Conexibacter sp.]|nr:GntR family transcriptional regulator [Conexibacter sp.]